ncbi:MAG TPA: dihydroorotate dehydrogenase electron transfer subunit [Candidatus Methylomirabilis sp.]|nr:dihydroorotate dehydrogenase electron transfer subunit [Candidatus Methylomirabilis sp.]
MQAEVHSLQRLHGDYYLQRFTTSPLAFAPGQFVMVKPSGSLDPFLPRAYSILRVHPHPGGRAPARAGLVEILYKVIGKGTTALSLLEGGDWVDLLGPLGSGFRVPPGPTTALLVSGGIGVPPVVALAERLASSSRAVQRSRFKVQGSGKKKGGHRSSDVGRWTLDVGRPKMVAFVGGKTRHDVLCLSDFRKAGATVRVATEDGSLGHRGLVTDLLDSFLRSSVNGERSSVYACGPHPMLEAVARIAEHYRVPCQLSLEADMACGFGACMGCVIPVRSSQFTVHGTEQSVNREPSTVNGHSYKLCCMDGPVFDAREIAW